MIHSDCALPSGVKLHKAGAQKYADRKERVKRRRDGIALRFDAQVTDAQQLELMTREDTARWKKLRSAYAKCLKDGGESFGIDADDLRFICSRDSKLAKDLAKRFPFCYNEDEQEADAESVASEEESLEEESEVIPSVAARVSSRSVTGLPAAKKPRLH